MNSIQNTLKIQLIECFWLAEDQRSPAGSRILSVGTREDTENVEDEEGVRIGRSEAEISLFRRLRSLILRIMITQPKETPANARPTKVTPMAITSHIHQSIDQLEVTSPSGISDKSTSLYICMIEIASTRRSYKFIA